jgi:hypothetical protein
MEDGMDAVATMEDNRVEWTPGMESPLPSARSLAQGVLGFVALGLTVALGSADLETAITHGPTALAVDAGSLLLTGPALLVGHQFLDLDAPVTALASDLLWAFTRSGGMALGLAPAFLFFSATSGLAPTLLGLALPAIGIMGLAHAAVGLLSSERAAGTETDPMMRMAKMRLLLMSWTGLTVLVGLRIGVRMVLA